MPDLSAGVTSNLTAVVLAGGTSRRLGGVDKTRLVLGGVTLLDRVLAVLPAGPVLVVGPGRPTVRPAVFVREEPPGGGPLAALAAGLAQVETERVLLLAADLPFLTAEALTALKVAAQGRDGALALDDEGRDQPLLSVWTASALRRQMPAEPAGGRLRRALDGLDAARVALPGSPPPWWDCDTPQAWEQAQAWTGRDGTAPLA